MQNKKIRKKRPLFDNYTGNMFYHYRAFDEQFTHYFRTLTSTSSENKPYKVRMDRASGQLFRARVFCNSSLRGLAKSLHPLSDYGFFYWDVLFCCMVAAHCCNVSSEKAVLGIILVLAMTGFTQSSIRPLPTCDPPL